MPAFGLAFMALISSLEDGSVKKEKLDGFTPQQRFFLGYAQIWCQNERPEALKNSVRTDPHSPGEFRVDGVVQNMPEFSTALVAQKANLWFRPTRAGYGNRFLNRLLLFSPRCSAIRPAQSQSGIDLSAIDKSAILATILPIRLRRMVESKSNSARRSHMGTIRRAVRKQSEDFPFHSGRLRRPSRSARRSINKWADFYQSCINEDMIEKLGGTPLQPGTGSHRRHRDPGRSAGGNRPAAQSCKCEVFFSFSSQPDPDNARQNIANLDQGGLGLPEKDFYFRSDSHSEEIRQKYVAHIAKMLVLSGVESACWPPNKLLKLCASKPRWQKVRSISPPAATPSCWFTASLRPN